MADNGTMSAAVVGEDRILHTQTVDKPDPGPGQVRIAVTACGICGSDLHMIASAALPSGTIMGHEFAGLIDAAGDGVTRVGEGDRVVVFPARPTAEHDLNAILTTSIGGPSAQGAYAEWVLADEDMLWPVPEDLELEHAALVEPLAVACHGVDLAQLDDGDACIVVGAGPIGLLVASVLRARGVEALAIVEKNAGRRERAEGLGFTALDVDGAHETVPTTLGKAPQKVFECAGHPSAPNLAIELVDVSGRVMLMGFLEEQVPISQLGLMLKEAELRSTWGYRPPNYDEAIELLRTGEVPAEDLITARVPLDEAAAMFAELTSPATEHIKVLLRPGASA